MTQNRTEFDVVIVGAGPVGLALARALRGLSVAVLCRGAAPRAVEDGPFDARVYAISPGNADFLRELRIWQALPSARVTPIHAMQVFGDRGDASLLFDAYRAGVPELAWTVEDAALNAACWSAAAVAEHVEVRVAELQGIDFLDERVELATSAGRIGARLVVGADGARSFVREAAGIPAKEGDYGQAAVVANFRCERPHRGSAVQWFEGGPVLALLPLPGERVSMVWSLPADAAGRLLELAPEQLCREVERASKGMLGALHLETPPKSYPLRRLGARRLAGPRVALAGDAAHVIHPLAGQGLNLGLQDARALAQTLAQREPGRDPGDARLLRRYERSRAEPVLAMQLAVEGLYRLFAAPGPAARLRNAGLNLTARLPVLTNLLMRHAMR